MVSQFKLFDDVIIQPKKDKRTRFQFRFHLNVMQDEQLLLAEELDTLKKQRRYTSTILDGLRLMLDMRQGSTVMLKTLFPGIVQGIQREAVEQIEPPANNQVMALMAQIVDIQAQLAQRQPVQALPAHVIAGEIVDHQQDGTPSIFVTDAIHDDPGAARATFANGLGNLFDFDQDEDF